VFFCASIDQGDPRTKANTNINGAIDVVNLSQSSVPLAVNDCMMCACALLNIYAPSIVEEQAFHMTTRKNIDRSSYCVGAAVPSDHLDTEMMNSVIGSGEY
jgi:hypothetical protein